VVPAFPLGYGRRVVESDAPDPKVPLERLQRLGDFEVLAPISEGGMASVWLGRSTAPAGELVAIKVIRAEHSRNKDFVAMLVDEAGIATRLSHPNILPVRSFGHDGKRHFLVMDLLRGHSLLDVGKAAHAQGKRLPVDVVAWIGARIADALHYAHELKDADGSPFGVVHRDVNPANVFITRDGEPKLIDFGLAKARDRIASTAIGVVKGKLAYLAPEQAMGHAADRRSDVFALGVTLWELSLDRRLFLDDSDVETVRRVRNADVPDPTTLDPGYPRALADAIARALTRDPEARWQTAAELRDALDAYLAGVGRAIGSADVRAALHDLYANEALPAWERIADENASERERTRIWNERKDAPAEPRLPGLPPIAPPPVRLPPTAAPAPEIVGATARASRAPRAPASLPSPAVLAAACAIAGGIITGLIVRGAYSGSRSDLDRRVARIEDLLGLEDAGVPSAEGVPPPGASTVDGGPALSADDHSGPCAVAKIAGYEAWQEALAKSKLNAGPAEAACADMRSEKKRQGCFYYATSETRTTQAARDAIIIGGPAAHDAVHAVKDDPKNPAVAKAHAASDAVFLACEGDAGS
jgi:serine/threonine protein kinase